NARGAAAARQFRDRTAQGYRACLRGRGARTDVSRTHTGGPDVSRHRDIRRRRGNLSGDEPAAGIPHPPGGGAPLARSALMNWEIFTDSLPELLVAAGGTLRMTVFAFLLAAVL